VDLRCGKFRLAGDRIEGPAAYLAERGNALVDRIVAGQDTVFNLTAHLSPARRWLCWCGSRPTTPAGWASDACWPASTRPSDPWEAHADAAGRARARLTLAGLTAGLGVGMAVLGAG
jgi:hypothetical protein